MSGTRLGGTFYQSSANVGEGSLRYRAPSGYFFFLRTRKFGGEFEIAYDVD